MRQKKAKAVRRAILGDQSPRLRQYVIGAKTGQIRRRDLGGAVRRAKAAAKRACLRADTHRQGEL